jgi:hypothetical protein
MKFHCHSFKFLLPKLQLNFKGLHHALVYLQGLKFYNHLPLSQLNILLKIFSGCVGFSWVGLSTKEDTWVSGYSNATLVHLHPTFNFVRLIFSIISYDSKDVIFLTHWQPLQYTTCIHDLIDLLITTHKIYNTK